jgi:hypothetical protein
MGWHSGTANPDADALAGAFQLPLREPRRSSRLDDLGGWLLGIEKRPQPFIGAGGGGRSPCGAFLVIGGCHALESPMVVLSG